MNLDTYREETREWLNENCPASMRDRSVHFEDAYEAYNTDDAHLWLERMAERGWTNGSELRARLRGTQGIGWSGAEFSEEELAATQGWLRDRAVTIYGGTNEVQLNIISKRVLGLPD